MMSHKINRRPQLQDEDGTFRNGENDGYSFPPSTIRTQQSSFLSDLKDDFSLRNLRESLKDAYPLHADEVEQNRLLFPSKYPYADTDSDNTLHRAYTQMVRLREMDKILQNAQRQGRISFYMTCHGEEAIHIGSASALELEDTVLAHGACHAQRRQRSWWRLTQPSVTKSLILFFRWINQMGRKHLAVLFLWYCTNRQR